MLGRSESFDLALASLALLGVGHRGGFYFHIVHAYTLSWLSSACWVVYLYKVYSNTLDILLRWLLRLVQFRQTIEGSNPFLGVLCFLNFSNVFIIGSKVVS